jgi:Flp pilus assembly protein TadG
LLGFNKLLRDISGSMLVETTLVMPMLLLLALGTIDAMYMFYEWGLANKAAHVGARTAVVSNPVASNVTNVSFTATELQNLGQLCFDPTTGNATGNCPSLSTVVCVSGGCGTGNTYNNAAFTRILTAMQSVFPRIAATNVQITYTPNGSGYVGQVYSGNVSQYALPMSVKVSIIGMTHQFFFIQSILRVFGGAIQATPAIPQFSTTMQSESLFTCTPTSGC